MHACQVTAENGQKHRLFIVLVGVKGDWVYLRTLFGCCNDNELDFVFWHACTLCEPKANVTNFSRASPRRGYAITAVRVNLA